MFIQSYLANDVAEMEIFLQNSSPFEFLPLILTRIRCTVLTASVRKHFDTVTTRLTYHNALQFMLTRYEKLLRTAHTVTEIYTIIIS